MKKIPLLSLLLVAIASAPSTLRAQINNFDAIQDATIFSESIDNNAGDHNFGIAGIANNGNERRLLLDFDLSSISPGSSVANAELSFNVNQVGNAGGTYSLFQVDTDWLEGTGVGNQGSTAAPGSVTWNEAQNGLVDWTDGGSFLPTALSTVSVSSNGLATLNSTAAFVSSVQSLVDDPSQNFGFILLSSDPGSAIRIDTQETAGGTPARLSVTTVAVPEPSTGILLVVASMATATFRRRR